ncbi:MAG: RNA polymerase sigma factor [candidate division Zixibacteria bacterium]|nr:RNA polymerase sigma factor [candidate division Zixibacteria bacterium]
MKHEAVKAQQMELGATGNAFAEDLSIAQEIAAGNRALFKQVYDRNINVLYNLARRLAGGDIEAEDIVQDTFIRAYQKINMFAGRSTLSSWLYRICVNVGLEQLRKKKGTYEDLNDSNCGTVEPDQKKLILRRKLDKAIKKLPQGCRTVFVLHDIEGFNHREIAERLNLAEGTSKSQLFKARMTLRKILGGSR